jgi:predicted helicase
MPDTFGWAVDGLVSLLNHADWGKVLKDFGKGQAKHDPVVHFYETFLNAYDPRMRKVRGVYYTPEPVVGYIVRSLHLLLQTHFEKPKGLADEETLILDPAVGTATLLFSVIQQIYAGFTKQKGTWDGYVSAHLLNRIFGFELLMAPYAVAHLKLGMELQDTGYKFESDQRLGIYLTNTLEEAAKKSERVFAQYIAEEADEAAEIKSTRPILVVLGNPPWSGHSANRSEIERVLAKGDIYSVVKGGPKRSQQSVVTRTAKKRMTVKERTFIGQLLRDYYYVDDLPLREKNPKWLQNDYVKFIRFAQWRIERTGHGILGFITDNSYLDNPTFRGMRQSLMQCFSEIHVYDLHGNSKKPDVAPDGGEDRNVFDIQQGAAIILAVKKPNQQGLADVYHAELWGLREHKYSVLSDTDVTGTKWTQLHPTTPNYYFFPQVTDLLAEYEQAWKLTDAMPLNVTGFQSHRDPFAIAFDKQTMVERMKRLRDAEVSNNEIREEYNIPDNRDWNLADARAELQANKAWESAIIRCSYRPLDWRWCYFGTVTMDYPRTELIENMAGKENLALNVCRQTKAPRWQHALVSDTPAPAVYVELKDGSNVFPLYLYPDSKQQTLRAEERQTNFSAKFIADLSDRLKLAWTDDGSGDLETTVGPEDVFAFAYAVFNAPGYQTRYVEFLKRDFPRLPLTSDVKLFVALAGKGRELIAIHLMQSPKLNAFITEFPIKGSNIIEKVTYVPDKQRVWINPQQYFGGVPQTIWESLIGGYQVCDKWLKDRKGRKLTYDETQHWQRIVLAVKETSRLTKEIDACLPGWPLP